MDLKSLKSSDIPKIRKELLEKQGFKCAICGKLAVEVHHIKPISTNWNERFNLDNLMPICTSCHNKQR